MKFKFLICFTFTFSYITILSQAQNNPEFDVLARNAVIINSGADFLLVSNINDGDSLNQNLIIEAISSDESILKVDSIVYKAGNRMAIIWVKEKSRLGSVTITVSVSDEDGTTRKDFEVYIAEYPHHGIKLEIHDAVFWQEVVPLNENPVFETVISSTNLGLAYSRLNWNMIPLTVSAGCDNPSLCDGHDFNTGFIKGYLVPKITGNYTFYMNGANDFALFLSPDQSFRNAGIIAANSDNHGKIGTVVDGNRKSGVVPLDSGQVYAIYAAQWNIHNETGGIKWELPGQFDAKFIEEDFLYPEYDTKRPDIVDNVRISATGDRFVRILWDESNDDQKLKGYNVYLNGMKANAVAISGKEMLLESLNPNTVYSIAVTAIDHVNNESFIKNIINIETLELDTITPSPPNSLTTNQATGLATEIAWDGASDQETYILGYNIYLNGKLYNTEDLVFSNTIILKVLVPNTDYYVEIESVDAGLNVSGKSQIFTVSTTGFDPLAENLGLKTGILLFSVDAMSYNEGIGVNPDFIGGDVFNDAHTTLLEDMKPGAIRWGALTANPLNFSDYVGANKSVTIGKFIIRCNEFDAYTAFCCGVENNTDWRKDPETFIRFLEYINGPDETSGGQLRVAEGYTEPFLKNSPGIIFEFGNEVWGSSTHNAQIGSDYNAYAAWCREIATKMRASEYYDSTKIYLAYSSRYPSREHSYGLNEKIINGDKGEVDWTAPSGYLGGNLSYDPAFPPSNSELEYYQNVRDRADSYLSGMLNSHKYEVDKTGRFMEQYMYESNTTTPTYNGRLGQALLSTDYYLSAMEIGSAIPTIFHLTGGEWRITEPENDYRRLPLFLTAKYFNQFCKGDVLINTYSSNQKGTSGTGAGFSDRPVGAHTYRNEGGYSIVLISRDYVDDHYVKLDLPEDLNFNSEGKMYLITGEDFSTKNAIIETYDVTVNDGMVINIPKHSMVLLHFGAENLEMENLPLAYYPYPKIGKIEIPKENFTFTKPLQSAQFSAKISPAESWDKHVEWTLLNNSGNFNLTKLGLYCTVSARSQLDNDTDSLVLRASSRIGDVFDEVVLYLPSSVNAQDIDDLVIFKIYPNPAEDVLIIEIKTADILSIYNMKGSKVLEKNLSEGRNDVDINHLSQGIYTVNLAGKSEQLLIQR